MEGGARVRRLGGVVAAIAVPAGAAAYLHRLGGDSRFRVDTSDLDVWLQVTPLEDVTAALLRLVGLVAAYWVLGSTALYLAACLSRIPAAVRAVEWMTLPVVRGAADRALAMLLAGSAVAAGAAPAFATDEPVWPPPVQYTETGRLPADDDFSILPPAPTPVSGLAPPREDVPPIPQPPSALPDESGQPSPTPERGLGMPLEDPEVGASPDSELVPVPRPPGDSVPRIGEHRRSLPDEPGGDLSGHRSLSPEGGAAGVTEPLPDTDTASESTAPESHALNAEARRYEVVAGDNLWVIAERALTEAWDREPSVAEVARYWLSVIDDNTARLRSGDPDLIYPGELLELPAAPTPEEASDD